MGWIMKKNFKVIIVICIFLSVLFVVSGCSFLKKANAEAIPKVEEETDALTRILEGLKPRVPDASLPYYEKLLYKFDSSVYPGGVNYQINYRWKDINLDVIDYSQFPDSSFTSKADIERSIALSEEQGYEWYISQLKGLGFENVQVRLKFNSISNIYNDYKVYFNEGHNELVQENEIIIPKWLYFYLYCTTLEEITCDKATVERILADDAILQRDMFLDVTDGWLEHGAFNGFHSLPISLGYYGIIDTTSPKSDMKLIMTEKFNFFDGYGDETYELSVVGYFETEADKYFDKPLAKGMYDYDVLDQYLFANTLVYFK